MKYNPVTDFVCYARATYGDEITTCYKLTTDEGEPHPCLCHEDRLITGKSETGCTPSEQTIFDRRK